MPTRKIGEVEITKTCQSPEHNPPSMMVWPTGLYEHECPTCGKITKFTILENEGYFLHKGHFDIASREPTLPRPAKDAD